MSNLHRRRFVAATALTIAATRFGMIDSTTAQPQSSPISFGPIKQIDAGVLNIGYAEKLF
jgi:hypothetical protein